MGGRTSRADRVQMRAKRAGHPLQQQRAPPALRQQQPCCVCVDVPDQRAVLPCQHVVCRDCWSGWQTQLHSHGEHSTCPACRAVVCPPPLDVVAVPREFAYGVPLANRELMRLTGRVAQYDLAMDHLRCLVDQRAPDDATRNEIMWVLRFGTHADLSTVVSESRPREQVAYDVWAAIIPDSNMAMCVGDDPFEVGQAILDGRLEVPHVAGRDRMLELAARTRVFVDTVRPDRPNYDQLVRVRIEREPSASVRRNCFDVLDQLNPELVARVAVGSLGVAGWVELALSRGREPDHHQQARLEQVAEAFVTIAGPDDEEPSGEVPSNERRDRGRLNRMLRVLPARLVADLANDHPPADLEAVLHDVLAARADDPSTAGLDEPRFLALFARAVMTHPANEAQQYYYHPSQFDPDGPADQGGGQASHQQRAVREQLQRRAQENREALHQRVEALREHAETDYRDGRGDQSMSAVRWVLDQIAVLAPDMFSDMDYAYRDRAGMAGLILRMIANDVVGLDIGGRTAIGEDIMNGREIELASVPEHAAEAVRGMTEPIATFVRLAWPDETDVSNVV